MQKFKLKLINTFDGKCFMFGNLIPPNLAAKAHMVICNNRAAGTYWDVGGLVPPFFGRFQSDGAKLLPH